MGMVEPRDGPKNGSDFPAVIQVEQLPPPTHRFLAVAAHHYPRVIGNIHEAYSRHLRAHYQAERRWPAASSTNAEYPYGSARKWNRRPPEQSPTLLQLPCATDASSVPPYLSE